MEAPYSKYTVHIYVERPRVVNFIIAGGGHPLCTLHRTEGLYGWVTRKGYMRDSLYKSLTVLKVTSHILVTGRVIE